MSIASSPPVLLTDATWWGTLAAARELGRRGVPVVLAADVGAAPARFSRFVRRVVRCPPTSDLDAFLEWLLAFGRREPGHVLCATSDETAWCFARNYRELAPWFQLTPVEPESLLALLDKARLMRGAKAAGLEVPDSWAPASEEEAVTLAASQVGPLFVKPRLQLFGTMGRKGERVEGAAEMAEAWRRQSDAASGTSALVQTCIQTTERIFTVDGFSGGPGAAFPLLGCVKRVQRPRAGGPGVVFEDAPVPTPLARALERLLGTVGFRGPFDAEFIEDGDRRLLIDLNPRFYNHMAFESERGLPLAWLSYVLARGDELGLWAGLCAASTARRDGPRLYVHRQPLRWMRWVQGLLGRLTLEERRQWDGWLDAEGVVDPTRTDDDPLPARAALLFEARRALRHPRSWLRALAFAPSAASRQAMIPASEQPEPPLRRSVPR
jgi:predicted ATP-grasp superfamily ATP-dependent carboligase